MTMLAIRPLVIALLAAAAGGCANSPQTRNFLWWPQGPGDSSELARSSSVRNEAQAIRRGNLVFVSGQTADAAGNIEAQVRGAMDKVVRILESHGLGSSNIISVTLYMREIGDLHRADAVYASYFPRDMPARSVVGVSTLPDGSLVEVSVVAGK
jgi:2-iminobutanoate/2-iminopropanoate deaminase